MTCSSSIAPVVAIIAITVTLLTSPVCAVDVAGLRDTQDIRQDLYDFIANQEKLLNTLEQIQPVNPHLRRRISTQMQLVSSLSPQKLMVLGQSNLLLRDVNSEMSRLLRILNGVLETLF